MKLIKQNKEYRVVLIKTSLGYRVTHTINHYSTERVFSLLGGAEAYSTFSKLPPFGVPIHKEVTCED